MAQAHALRLLRAALLGAIVGVTLTACGGGGGESSSGLLGGGQNPDPAVQDFPVAYVKRPLLLDEDGDLHDVRRARSDRIHAGRRTLRSRSRVGECSRTQHHRRRIPERRDGQSAALRREGSFVVVRRQTTRVRDARAGRFRTPMTTSNPRGTSGCTTSNRQSLHRVISSDITAEIGQDVAPHFLPDGRIVFASTRQRDAKAVLLDEGKPQFAAQVETRRRRRVVAARDGRRRREHPSDLVQPEPRHGSVGAGGWTHRVCALGQRANQDAFSLYTMNPDGTEQKCAVRRAQPRHRTERRSDSIRRTAGTARWSHARQHATVDCRSRISAQRSSRSIRRTTSITINRRSRIRV